MRRRRTVIRILVGHSIHATRTRAVHECEYPVEQAEVFEPHNFFVRDLWRDPRAFADSLV